MRRREAWCVLLATLVVLVVSACGGGIAPADTLRPDDPSASTLPLTEDDLAVCDGTIRMAQGAARLRQIRLRKGALDRLERAVDLVVEGNRLVVEYASTRMRARVRTLGFALTNMSLAVEDFRTTDRLDAAAANVKRRTTALRRAIDSFRSWLGCPEPTAGATPDPDATVPADTEPAA